MAIVQEHIDRDTLRETMLIPEHEKRKYSSLFEKGKKRLKEDGNYCCWVCGSLEQLEIHHFICEFATSNVCDFEKMRVVSQIFDPYGYGKELSEQPIDSVDDIRNMMVLCRLHHRQTYTGIHNLTFSTWIMQKIAMDGRTVVIDEDA